MIDSPIKQGTTCNQELIHRQTFFATGGSYQSSMTSCFTDKCFCNWELLSELIDSSVNQETTCDQELFDALIDPQTSCNWKLLSELIDSLNHAETSCNWELLSELVDSPIKQETTCDQEHFDALIDPQTSYLSYQSLLTPQSTKKLLVIRSSLMP